MLTKVNFLVLLAFLMSNVACSKKQSSQKIATEIKEFTLPDIPVMFTDSVEIASYLAMHYWDNFDFKDTTAIQQHQKTEAIFLNYINLLKLVPNNTATHSIKNLMQKAQSDKKVFTYFWGLCERYLYEPTSPLRNDELFIPALELVVSSELIDSAFKVRPNFQLNMALKNRIRTKTTDLHLLLEKGKTIRIYDCKAQYVILIFYNPNCHTCHDIISQMKKSDLLTKFLSINSLKIIAISTDNNKEEWIKYKSNIPTTWLNGLLQPFDNQISKYDLKASPTLYLLDKSKTVILKDAQIEQIIDFLNRNK